MLAELRGLLGDELAKRLSRCLVLNDAGCRLSTVNHARYAWSVEAGGLSNKLKRRAAAAG